MADCKFKVGDRVAVMNWAGTFSRISTVRRVMVRFVELDNGSKWQLDGNRYPRRQLGDFAHITDVTPEHEIASECKSIAFDLKHDTDWESLNLDQLRRVMAVVNEGKGEANG